MADIKECINQCVKTGKTSVTIKNADTGKTKGGFELLNTSYKKL